MANKSFKVNKPRIIDPDLGDEDQGSSEPIVVEEAPAPQVKKTQDDWVRITMFETIEPSPVIGSFSFLRDLSITRLEEKKTYSVPKHVAEVLVDKKKGQVV